MRPNIDLMHEAEYGRPALVDVPQRGKLARDLQEPSARLVTPGL
jgi:hypothetical protein